MLLAVRQAVRLPGCTLHGDDSYWKISCPRFEAGKVKLRQAIAQTHTEPQFAVCWENLQSPAGLCQLYPVSKQHQLFSQVSFGCKSTETRRNTEGWDFPRSRTSPRDWESCSSSDGWLDTGLDCWVRNLGYVQLTSELHSQKSHSATGNEWLLSISSHHQLLGIIHPWNLPII